MERCVPTYKLKDFIELCGLEKEVRHNFKFRILSTVGMDFEEALAAQAYNPHGICCLFCWKDTPEGEDFWADVHGLWGDIRNAL